jgi:hypothetical protein
LKDEVLAYIDEFLELILQSDAPVKPYLYDFTHFLAETAPDRGPVKFAIALLGVIGDWRDIELISILGGHEEFTLYSAVAISNLLEDPEKRLWELAKKVNGWGKIHVVSTRRRQSPMKT